MSAFDEDLPLLDCHAHVAGDASPLEVQALGGAVVFAVTRSVAEGLYAVNRGDPTLVWGCGLHPGDSEALAEYDPSEMRSAVRRFALIGEIGLHGRAGNRARQREVLRDILHCARSEPVLLSIHSSGAVADVLELVLDKPHPGTILHWFLGDSAQTKRAVAAGFHFSVNAAMDDAHIAAIPVDRLLPETDFPAARRASARRPGDTTALERRLAVLWQRSEAEVRRQLYRNLRNAASASGSVDRMPERLQDFLLTA